MLKPNANRKPSLPGQILKELFLQDRGITIKAFAEAVGVTAKHISHVIHGKARIEADLATRIATVLGTSVEVWINLQSAIDIWDAKQRLKNWKPKQFFIDPKEVRI